MSRHVFSPTHDFAPPIPFFLRTTPLHPSLCPGIQTLGLISFYNAKHSSHACPSFLYLRFPITCHVSFLLHDTMEIPQTSAHTCLSIRSCWGRSFAFSLSLSFFFPFPYITADTPSTLGRVCHSYFPLRLWQSPSEHAGPQQSWELSQLADWGCIQRK